MLNTEIKNKQKGLFLIFNNFWTSGSYATALCFYEHRPSFLKLLLSLYSWFSG